MRGDSLETSRLKTKVKEDEDKVETQVTRSVHNDLQILQNFIFLQPLWSSVSDLLSSKIVLFGPKKKILGGFEKLELTHCLKTDPDFGDQFLYRTYRPGTKTGTIIVIIHVKVNSEDDFSTIGCILILIIRIIILQVMKYIIS